MSKKLARLFGQIEKVEEQPDGTLIVSGVASTEARDSQKEIVTAGAMKASIPDYMKFGAVREMHQPSAAGTALGMEVDADGITRIEAHVVDPNAVAKVKANVYKGFSIGGAVTSRDKVDKTIITGMNLIEVSLVDRPANPEAVIDMWKADGIEPEPAAVEGDWQPSNDQVALVAQELAKADTTKTWIDFIETARDSLIKAKKAKDDGKDDDEEDDKDDDDAEEGDDKEGDDGKGKDDDGEGDDKKSKKAATPQAPSGEEGDWAQVWKTKDGETFATKAEAVKHAGELRAAETVEPLSEAIAELSDVVKADGSDDKSKKPYGDVTYADPGYQKDKKKRYPLDTAAHIRAAWSYINQGKNAKMYSSSQVDSIKAKIVSAWKDKIDADGPPSAEKMAAMPTLAKALSVFNAIQKTSVAKGLYTVQRTACVLEHLSDIAASVAWEEKYEGDIDSNLPQQAADLIAAMRTFVVEMVNEECGELLTALQGIGGDDIPIIIASDDAEIMELGAKVLDLAKADGPDTLAKVGARHSAKDKDSIQAVHDHSQALGAMCDSANCGDDAGKIAKVAADEDTIAKINGLEAENTRLKKIVDTAVPQIEALVEDVRKLKAAPMPAAPRTHVVGKTDDTLGLGEAADTLGKSDAEQLMEKFTPDELAEAAIKIAQRNPMPLGIGRR